MKSDRLLSALLLLQAHRRLSGRELAERLEVSERTIHRDMESLSAAGVPISAARGAQGGWQLEPGWRTQVPGMDSAELNALLMSQPRALGDPRLAAAAERAFEKLIASLSGPMRTRAEAIRERLHIDSTGWHPSTEDLSLLSAVQSAVAADFKISFDYTRADGQSGPRTVDPLGLVAKGSSWYLSPARRRGCALSASRASSRSRRCGFPTSARLALTSPLTGRTPPRNSSSNAASSGPFCCSTSRPSAASASGGPPNQSSAAAPHPPDGPSCAFNSNPKSRPASWPSDSAPQHASSRPPR